MAVVDSYFRDVDLDCIYALDVVAAVAAAVIIAVAVVGVNAS